MTRSRTADNRSEDVAYRHYIDELSRKPQALRQVVPELRGNVAPREGLEPPTRGLEGRCSIQLSYRGAA